jgi:hypothetical protein
LYIISLQKLTNPRSIIINITWIPIINQLIEHMFNDFTLILDYCLKNKTLNFSPPFSPLVDHNMQKIGLGGRWLSLYGLGIGLDYVSLLLGIVIGIKFGFPFPPFYLKPATPINIYIFIIFFIKFIYYTQNLILFIFYKLPK